MNISSVPMTNCDNCGAVLTDGYCEYCGTRWFFVKQDKVVEKPTIPPSSNSKVTLFVYDDDDLIELCPILSYTDIQHSLPMGRDMTGRLIKSEKKSSITIETYYSTDHMNLLRYFSSKVYPFKINFSDAYTYELNGYLSEINVTSRVGALVEISFTITEY